MKSSIRARLQSGIMLSFSIKEMTSEQSYGREKRLTTCKARNEKSNDAIANIKVTLAKLELAMIDIRKGMD